MSVVQGGPPLLVGVDLTEIARIDSMIREHADRLLERCFTSAERAYCDAHHARRAEHYAARFAAKEATLKAMGTGWSGGIAWTDVEVVRPPDGAPSLALSGKARVIADEMGIEGWRLSLSHGGGFAIATSIAWLGCSCTERVGESST